MRRVLNSSDFRTLQVASQVLHERREVSVSHRSDLSGQFLQANDGLRFVDFPEVGIAMPGQATFTDLWSYLQPVSVVIEGVTMQKLLAQPCQCIRGRERDGLHAPVGTTSLQRPRS